MNSRLKFWVVSSSTCLVLLLLLGAVRGRSANPEDTYRHLAVYTEVLQHIKADYVEEPDMKGVTVGALVHRRCPPDDVFAPQRWLPRRRAA